MMTLASAQPVEPPPSAWPRDSTSGITWGTLPLAFWSAARSASHLVKNPATSKLKAAVGANAWASPVQPRRSSRCGQSVGTSRKLRSEEHTSELQSQSNLVCRLLLEKKKKYEYIT